MLCVAPPGPGFVTVRRMEREVRFRNCAERVIGRPAGDDTDTVNVCGPAAGLYIGGVIVRLPIVGRAPKSTTRFFATDVERRTSRRIPLGARFAPSALVPNQTISCGPLESTHVP